MPIVSVVLPVYNCRAFLEEALESILKQSFRNFETVVVDDGSHDGSQEIIQQYATKTSIEVIVHDRNVGICQSLNDGIAKARGIYVAIQHADDVSVPERLEKQVRYLEVHPYIDLVAGWIQYINRRGKQRKDDWWLKTIKKVPDEHEVIKSKLLEMNIIPHPTVMFRKKIIETVGLYDPDAFPTEDYDYWLRISEHHAIGIIREPICFYRRHRGQLTRTEKMRHIQQKTIEAVQRAKERRGLDTAL